LTYITHSTLLNACIAVYLSALFLQAQCEVAVILA